MPLGVENLTLDFTKDSYKMLDKLICLLLCVVGAVVAQNTCTTFGNVIGIDRACINSTIGSDVFMNTNLTHRLTLMCSKRFDYALCMQENTAECDEAPDIIDEVVASIGVCDTTNGADLWAAKYLEPYLMYEGCQPDMAAMPSCTSAVGSQMQNFPFSNEPFKQGLDTLHAFKRLYFDCMTDWLQASTDCSQNWRQTYLSHINLAMVSNRFFGLYLDSQDIADFEQKQAEIVAEQAVQATVQVRDLFRDFPLFDRK